MLYDPEVQILAFLIFAMLGAIWSWRVGLFAHIGDLTVIERARPDEKPAKAAVSGLRAPVLLAPSTDLAQVRPQPAAAVAPTSGTTTTVPSAQLLDPATQLSLVSRVLNEAIETAERAERLHAAAHERLDSAHYALQNLLAELSSVLPVAAPAALPETLTDALAQAAPPSSRPTYVTALAA